MSYVLAKSWPIKYPYSIWDLRNDNPNVSFAADPAPADLAAYHVYPVIPSPRPADSRELRAVEAEPIRTDEGWRQVWTVREATPEEIEEWDAAYAAAPELTPAEKLAAIGLTVDELKALLAS